MFSPSRVRYHWLIPISMLLVLALINIYPLARANPRHIHSLDPNRPLVQAIQQSAESLQPQASGSTALLHDMVKVGFEPLPGLNADVWAHRGVAYVGSWGLGGNDLEGLCPSTGVRMIDLAEPREPELLGAVAEISGTTQEDVVVKQIRTEFFEGDLLVTGIQACDQASDAPRGIDLWDVTNRSRPRHLAFWSSSPSGEAGARGVHELYLFQRGNRAYVAAAVPFSEFFEGQGDFRLVDVTDPRTPVQVSDWGLRDIGVEPICDEVDFDPCYFDHSAFVTEDGNTAILSYWDYGAIFLDISEPASPTFIGRTEYPSGADGNTHSVALADGERFLLTADEDFSPIETETPLITDTWGFLRIWDVRDQSEPVEVARFGTDNALMPRTGGFYSIHNPFVKGQHAYLSWYSDGVRVLDISEPHAPREIAAFVPEAVPDPFEVLPTAPLVWGVYVHRNLILVSDINAGLYILRLRDMDGRELTTTLTGEAEVPGPGDSDGGGEAVLRLYPARSTICYQLEVFNIEPATAAHIHVAPRGEAGPVVVPLEPPRDGAVGSCVGVDPELIRAILDNPENYYVNVHNILFPGGAIRGQLAE